MRTQLGHLEEKIRIHTESSRVRLHEYFIDYDRLRSGFVTKTQFQRLLDQILKGALTHDEIQQLTRKYESPANGLVNYRVFSDSLFKNFPDNDLKEHPEAFVSRVPEYLGTKRSMQQLDESEHARLNALLARLTEYYERKTIDVLTFFRDFDRNNIGVITESQFRRAVTEPPMSEPEMNLLIRKYQRPDMASSVNYLNFFNDLNESSSPQANTNLNNNTNELLSDINAFESSSANNKLARNALGGISVQEIINKISVASHKEGIRVGDFFKDYDRLRSGVITDRQFATALTTGLTKPANISAEEIQQLVEYFRVGRDRCRYNVLVDTVDNVFNVPDMEKKPMARVYRPPGGLLSKTLNSSLTAGEEELVAHVIAKIAERVRKYKLTLFTYFKDFDRSTAYTRNVSKIQFGRVLLTLNLMPSSVEFDTLVRKFEDPTTSDVNYPAFCQAVEEDFVASIVDQTDYDDAAQVKEHVEKAHAQFEPDTSNVDLLDLMARIRDHALVNRIRIKEFFQDMDPLNSGEITRSQFVRCLSSFGVSTLGTLVLSKPETDVLLSSYRSDLDPAKKTNWKKFEQDVETVFTLPELEKNPNQKVSDSSLYVLPPPGTVKWDDEELSSTENYKTVIDKLALVVKQRRIDVWPSFKDYDKLNHGHVTKQQFHQCLAGLNLHVSEKDKTILEAKYLDRVGFNYQAFLTALSPQPRDPARYFQLKEQLAKANCQRAEFEAQPVSDVQSILAKLRDQVFKRRVSIYEWLRDHDKLNAGRIPKETFRRAFDLCNLSIEKSELDLISGHFESRKDDRLVEYREFCRQVEQAFSNDQYEKNPLLQPEQHTPVEPWNTQALTPDESDTCGAAMAKLAERVRAQRINLFPLFEDFDRVKNGYVTQSQFRRVLNDLGMAVLMRDVELDSVMKRYRVKIGTRDDVNFIAFSDRLYELGSFEYRRP